MTLLPYNVLLGSSFKFMFTNISKKEILIIPSSKDLWCTCRHLLQLNWCLILSFLSSSFFLLLSSLHAPLVHYLLLFQVERKVFGFVTCFSIVPDFNGLAAVTISSIVIIGKLFCVIEIDFNVLVKGQSCYCSIIFEIPYVALIFF